MSVDGKIIIISVVDDTPAYSAGIKAGDIILKVDKTNVSGKTINDVASLIRGERGSSVNIELLRDKKKIKQYWKIKREMNFSSLFFCGLQHFLRGAAFWAGLHCAL